MQENETTIGYFAAANNEKFEKGMSVTTGRAGIYYKKQELISIVTSKPVKPINQEQIHIIKICIPETAIIKEQNNNERFRIKGHDAIMVINTEMFTDAIKKIS